MPSSFSFCFIILSCSGSESNLGCCDKNSRMSFVHPYYFFEENAVVLLEWVTVSYYVCNPFTAIQQCRLKIEPT